MKTKHIDFEGNFGSQDPALQLTPEDTAAFSRYFQEQRQRRAAEATAPKPARLRRKTAA